MSRRMSSRQERDVRHGNVIPALSVNVSMPSHEASSLLVLGTHTISGNLVLTNLEIFFFYRRMSSEQKTLSATRRTATNK
jgi:hypothetical protein